MLSFFLVGVAIMAWIVGVSFTYGYAKPRIIATNFDDVAPSKIAAFICAIIFPLWWLGLWIVIEPYLWGKETYKKRSNG